MSEIDKLEHERQVSVIGKVAFLFSILFIREDFPTLLLPEKAISAFSDFGIWLKSP